MVQFPWTIQIAGHPVLVHGLLEAAGIFIGFRYYLYLKKKQGDTISTNNRLAIAAAAIFGAVVGSRLIGALEDPYAWMTAPSAWAYFNGNKTLLGGLLGGLLFVEVTKALIRETQRSGDLFTYPLLLGMIIGRIGCFSAGIYEETYGLPSKLPWALDLGDGIPRHPVTLYEIGFLMVLWRFIRKKEKQYVLEQGAAFKMLMIAYMLFRLLLDFIKPGYRYFFGLGTIQLTSIAGLLYYLRYIINPRNLVISPKKAAHAR